ncbi:MAG: N-methyl-L-tryptophan oxidase [Actinobacteria bacterium]|nr:N-methyl-L-tryptophan oxidase [Actinomycetota bacterium]
MDRYDVAVVGLGGIGAAIACHLARRGRSVVGLDRHSPPHVHGSSHGRSRIIRKAYFEGTSYVPLLERAYAAWSDLEADAGTRLLTITGGLFIGREDDDVVTGTLRSAEAHDLEHERLDAAEVRQRFPALRLAEDEVAVYEADAGIVFPEAAQRAHLRVADASGARLRVGMAVNSWTAEDESIRLDVDQGPPLFVDRLVLAPGPWAAGLLQLDVPFVVERQCMFWFQRGTDDPQLQPPDLPIFMWSRGDGPAIYGAPGLRGEGPKVAFHHGGDTGELADLDPEVRSEDESELRAVLRERLPALDVAPSEAMVCRYTNTPDGHFVVGPHPDAPNVMIAAGFSGHGYKFCPVIGEAVAALVIDGTTDLDLSLFDPARFSGSEAG